MTDQSHSGPLLEKIPNYSILRALGKFAFRPERKEDDSVLTVTKDGEVLWNPNAEAMIADDSLWDESSAGMRHLLRMIFNSTKETDKVRSALNWYKDEAEALAKHSTTGTDAAIMAGLRVLSLDGGKRAVEALKALDEARLK